MRTPACGVCAAALTLSECESRTLSQHKEFEASAADYKVQLRELAEVVDRIFHKSECDQMSGLRDTWSRPEEKKISASDTALTTNIAILHSDSHPMVSTRVGGVRTQTAPLTACRTGYAQHVTAYPHAAQRDEHDDCAISRPD